MIKLNHSKQKEKTITEIQIENVFFMDSTTLKTHLDFVCRKDN